jgi:LacI family transcriptional regulator
MGAIARRAAGPVTAPIMILSDWPAARYWQNSAAGLRRFHRGLLQRTEELGYRIDEFWTRAAGMSPRRAEQILAARGTQGIVVLNYPEAPAKLALDLSPYASVVIGRALIQPRLYAVDHDHHQGLFECLKQVSARGYRRPGLLLTFDSHERSMHCWAAAYHFFLSHLAVRDRIPFLLIKPGDTPAIKKWFKNHRPDVILTADFTSTELLTKIGLRVPEDVGVAALFWREENQNIAGIDIQDESQASRAIDLLVEQMRRNQHGIPHKPETVLFDGFWRDGASLPTRELPYPLIMPKIGSARNSPGKNRPAKSA